MRARLLDEFAVDYAVQRRGVMWDTAAGLYGIAD